MQSFLCWWATTDLPRHLRWVVGTHCLAPRPRVEIVMAGSGQSLLTAYSWPDLVQQLHAHGLTLDKMVGGTGQVCDLFLDVALEQPANWKTMDFFDGKILRLFVVVRSSPFSGMFLQFPESPLHWVNPDICRTRYDREPFVSHDLEAILGQCTKPAVCNNHSLLMNDGRQGSYSPNGLFYMSAYGWLADILKQTTVMLDVEPEFKLSNCVNKIPLRCDSIYWVNNEQVAIVAAPENDKTDERMLHIFSVNGQRLCCFPVPASELQFNFSRSRFICKGRVYY